MNEEEYYKIRDKIVNEMDTEKTIWLVVDLFGNLMDLEEDIEDEKILEMYEDLKLFINDKLGVSGALKWTKQK